MVGVDLGGTNVRASAVRPDGSVMGFASRPTEVVKGTSSILARIEEVVEKASRCGREEGARLVALGVAVPGPLEAVSGVVHQPPNFPQWRRFPLKKHLEEIFRLPIFLDNDGNCAAVGERWLGAASGCRHVVVLTLGTGVGGGLIVDGELVRGAEGFAGEVGHVVVASDGAPCNCGGRGCLEAYSSATGLKRMLAERLTARELAEVLDEDGRLDVKAAAAKARRGDQRCRQAFTDAGRFLGAALASFVNLFNPQMVVIGGGMAGAWGLIVPVARAEMLSRAFARPARRVRILKSALGGRAGVMGAAAIAWSGLARQARGGRCFL